MKVIKLTYSILFVLIKLSMIAIVKQYDKHVFFSKVLF